MLPVKFRHPTLLAFVAVTVDVLDDQMLANELGKIRPFIAGKHPVSVSEFSSLLSGSRQSL